MIRGDLGSDLGGPSVHYALCSSGFPSLLPVMPPGPWRECLSFLSKMPDWRYLGTPSSRRGGLLAPSRALGPWVPPSLTSILPLLLAPGLPPLPCPPLAAPKQTEGWADEPRGQLQDAPTPLKFNIKSWSQYIHTATDPSGSPNRGLVGGVTAAVVSNLRASKEMEVLA